MDNYDAEITYDTETGGGYTLIPHRSMSKSVQEKLWFSSLPNGSNWNDPKYKDAKIIKTFEVGNEYAVSYANVTAQSDESGRSGILNAKIKLFSKKQYDNWLGLEYEKIQKASTFFDFSVFWQALLYRIKNRDLSDKKLVIYSPYESQQDIELNKSILISLCYRQSVDKMVVNLFGKKTFTTLALSPRDKSPIICIPEQEISNQNPEHINIRL